MWAELINPPKPTKPTSPTERKLKILRKLKDRNGSPEAKQTPLRHRRSRQSPSAENHREVMPVQKGREVQAQELVFAGAAGYCHGNVANAANAGCSCDEPMTVVEMQAGQTVEITGVDTAAILKNRPMASSLVRKSTLKRRKTRKTTCVRFMVTPRSRGSLSQAACHTRGNLRYAGRGR